MRSAFIKQNMLESFARGISLKIHMIQIHSGKGSGNLSYNVTLPYICLLDRFKRTFQNKTYLELHQNLHRRGTYSCQFCEIIIVILF